jgi:SAM-dependent methyltransferase
MMRLDFVKDSRVLHIAPERLLANWMKENGVAHYLSGDLYNEADIRLNIEHMDLEDAAFDAIICMHVLEHVNDQKALKEMRRILRPGGTAFIMVPIVEGWDQTYENPSIETDSGRLLHFGQEDHIRYYGRDVRDRLSNLFEVEEITAVEPDVSRYALVRGEKIFLCRRPFVD